LCAEAGPADTSLRTPPLPPNTQSNLISDLSPSEFLEALALAGLSVFESRRAAGAPGPATAPEQRLLAFFRHLGVPPPPAAALDAGARGPCGFAGGCGGAPPARDPYAEWWGMEFGPEAEGGEPAAGGGGSGSGGSGGYRSSQLYHLVLLQVCVGGMTDWLEPLIGWSRMACAAGP
jgi:hypothetical protein